MTSPLISGIRQPRRRYARQITGRPLLKAAPDAPVAGGLYDLVANNVDPKTPASGKFVQDLDLVRGNPNGTPYYSVDYEGLPVAVVEKIPYSIVIEQPKVPIVRDGTMKLKVKAIRHDGYDKKIVVRMLWRPPGITCPSTMTFTEKQTELEYELNANANAEIATWNITMLAESTGDKGMMVCAAPFAKLSVEEPYVKMKMNMSTVKQGQPVDMICALEQLREFDGQGDLQIFGLPAKSSTNVLKVDKKASEVRFPITTAIDTPVGQHKNLFCTFVVMKNGEPITHRIGMGGILRVDPKPKEVVAAAPKPAAKPAAKPATDAKKPAAKPLSRLEQLRLEAKKQAASQ
ncbi:MAG: hypothetical protein AAF226_19630, partial [Verrucomicrobiota bacterium]